MLEQANATQQVFTMWMQPGILAGHEEPRSKRLCALALMCLLRLPSNAVPTSIRSGFNQIFIKTIEILSNLEQQRSELEEEGSFWDVNNNGNGGGGTLKMFFKKSISLCHLYQIVIYRSKYFFSLSSFSSYLSFSVNHTFFKI